MAGLLLVSLLVSILAAGGHPFPGNFPADNTDTSCTAFGVLSIETTAPHCEGVVKADCKVLDDTRVCKDDVIEAWFKNGVCDEDAQEEAATKLTDSVGTVWGHAMANITCGQGFGCGFVLVDPSSWGARFAEMITQSAKKILKTGKFPELEHFCALDLRDLKTALAHESNEALSEVCTEGGSEETYHIDYSKFAKSYVLAALKKAASGICGTLSKDSECNPAKKKKVEVVPLCSGSAKSHCCVERSIRHGFCLCSGCANPLKLVIGTDRIIWKDRHHKKCECPEKAAMIVMS